MSIIWDVRLCKEKKGSKFTAAVDEHHNYQWPIWWKSNSVMCDASSICYHQALIMSHDLWRSRITQDSPLSTRRKPNSQLRIKHPSVLFFATLHPCICVRESPVGRIRKTALLWIGIFIQHEEYRISRGASVGCLQINNSDFGSSSPTTDQPFACI